MTYESLYLYSNPGKHGLTVIYEYEAHEPDYDFDLLLVWREAATGKLWAAADSGCSCPMPFEGHVFPQDFTEVRAWEDVKALLDYNWPVRTGNYTRHRRDHGALRAAVKRALA